MPAPGVLLFPLIFREILPGFYGFSAAFLQNAFLLQIAQKITKSSILSVKPNQNTYLSSKIVLKNLLFVRKIVIIPEEKGRCSP